MSKSKSNSNFNNSGGYDTGRGPELKYELYFPPNSCMPKDTGMGKCPTYPYPLQNIPSCQSIYVPCTDKGPVNTEIYGNNPAPSELYGDALGMNEGNGLFYYHDPYKSAFQLSALTFQNNQPYHYARTQY